MDYYSFDLQLFAADVTVNFTTGDKKPTAPATDTRYYAKIGETATWYDSLSALDTAAKAATPATTAEDALIAVLTGGQLTVAVGDSAFKEDTVTDGQYAQKLVELTGVTPAGLDGVSVAIAKKFSVTTVDNLLTASAVNGEAGAVATVAIGKLRVTEGTGTDTIGSVAGRPADTFTFATTGTTGSEKYTATVSSGIIANYADTKETATCTTIIKTPAVESVYQLTAGDANATVDTLVSGEINLKAGATIKVGKNSYTANKATETDSSVQLLVNDGDTMATLVSKAPNSGETARRESIVELVNGSSIKIGDDTAEKSTAAGTIVKNTKSDTKIYVGSAGTIQGLVANDTFTVTDGADTTTAYSVAAGAITASGNYAGVYTITDPTKVKITSVLGKADVVEEEGGETPLSPVGFNTTFEIPKQDALGTNYYKVTYDSESTKKLIVSTTAATGSTDAEKQQNAQNGVGYFAVTTSAYLGKVKTTVVFYDGAGNKSSLITDTPISFGNLAKVAGKELGYIDVTGIAATDSAAYLNLTEVPSSVAGNITGITAGTTEAPKDTVAYATSYVIGTKSETSTDTLKIAKITAANTSVYYEIEASEPDKYGVVTYSIKTTGVAESEKVATKPYFKVATGTGSDGSYPYTISFEAGSSGLDLKADCWAGLKVDAKNVDNATAIAGTVPTDAKVVYNVTANVGTVITVVDGKVTGKWDGVAETSITVKSKDAEDQEIVLEKGIALLDGSGTGTEYWEVTVPTEKDGNNKITITKAANQVSAPADKAYIKVEEIAGDPKTVKVTYVPGTYGISLSGLTNAKDSGKAVKVLLDGAGLKDGVKLVVTDTTSDATYVDYAITVPGGTKVEGAEDDRDTVAYKDAYRNEAVLSVKGLEAGSYYCEMVVGTKQDAEGYVSVTAGTPTKYTGSVPTTVKNYFTVTKDADGKITVACTTESLTFKDGKATVDVNGDTTVTEIALPAASKGDDYKVKDATAKIKDSGITRGGASIMDDAARVSFVDSWALGAGSADLSLAGIQDADGKRVVYYTVTKTPGTLASKGVTSFVLASLDASGLDENTLSYISATYAGGKITLDFVEGSAANKATRDDLANLTDKIKVNAALDKTVASAEIVLTDDAAGRINYAVYDLPATASVTGKGDDDTVEYKKTYEMVTEETATAGHTITLAKATGAETVAYYAVTSEDAGKGIQTVSIAKTAIDMTGKTDAQISETLAATQGYITVAVDEKGAVTITYTQGGKNPIDMDGLTVDVNAASYTTTKTEIGGASETITVTSTDSVKFAVTGLDYDQSVKANSPATKDEAWNASAVIKNGITLASKTASDFSGGSSITEFYTVDTTTTEKKEGRTTYTISSSAVSEGAKGSHYFAVTYSQYGITVTYVNADSDPAFDLKTATGGKMVEVNAGGIASDVTTIDISDGTNAVVNYALLDVGTNVKVTGATEGEDTIMRKGDITLTDATITLAASETKATLYYTIVSATDATTGKTTYTIGAGSATQPGSTANYFTVVNNGSNAFTVEYTQATAGSAYVISGEKAGKVTIQAANAASLDLKNNSTAYAHFAVEGLKPTAAVSNMDSADTVSYSTTFAWAEGTYLIPATKVDDTDTYVLAVGKSAKTVKDADTEYVPIKVAVDKDGVYSIAVDTNVASGGKRVKATGSNGKLAEATVTATISVIEAPPAKFNANHVVYTFTDVAAGTALTDTETSTTTITTVALKAASGTTAADTIIVQPNGGTEKTYTAGGDGILVLKGDGTVTSGILALAAGAANALTGATSGWSASISTGSAVVTFAAGKITSITGLDKDEILTVNQGGDTYEYSSDGTLIYKTKTSDSSTTYAAASSTADLMAIGYSAQQKITNVGTFSWNESGAKTYYLAVDSQGACEVKKGEGAGTVSSTGTYLIAEIDSSSPKKLKLTPAKGNAAGLVDPITDGSFKGTVTISPTIAIEYTKETGSGSTVIVNNAVDGSVFTDMTGAEDTITTASLAINTGKITMQVTKADGTVDATKTAIYKAAAAGQMVFTAGALYTGTVTIDKTTAGTGDAGTLRTADGSTIVFGTKDASAEVKVVEGEITGISKLGTTTAETITVTSKDGTTTTYTSNGSDGKTVTKTVIDGTTGEKTVTELTIAADGDVYAGTVTGEKIKNNFAFDDTTSTMARVGYFEVGTDASDDTTYNKATVAADTTTEVALKPRKVYIKAENVVTGAGTPTDPYVNTLKLTPMVVSAEKKLVPATGQADEARVTVTATGTTKPILYAGSGNIFKTDFTDVIAGSEFTGLAMGSTVTTGTLAENAVIKVNTVEYKTVKSGGSDTFVIYSDGTTSSRIVKGTVEVTADAAMHAAEWDDTNKKLLSSQTLTYTAGTESDETYNGVVVEYGGTNGGVPQSIKGLEKGAKVEIVSTASDGTVTTTTYQATTDTTGYVYRTDGTTTTVKTLAADGGNIYANTGYETLDKPDTKTFKWADAKPATTDPVAAATSTKGYFLMTDGKASVSDQSSAVTVDYTGFGKTYVVAEYSGDASSNALTLNKKAVTYQGGLPDGAGAFSAKDAVSVTVTGARKIVYARGAMGSIAILGAGAGTTITTTSNAWSADDRLTATLAGAVLDKNKTVTKAAETVTIGDRVYTSGAASGASTTLDVRGDTVYDGVFLLQPAGTGSEAAKKLETVTAYKLTTNTDGTKETTTTAVAYEGTDKAAVMVEEGVVTSLTGLAAGETVKITTTTVDGFGTQTEAIDTYAATKGTGDKSTYIKVTKTTKDGTQYVHYFANDTQDVLAESVTWSVSSQTTVSTFDWSSSEATQTGYFVTTADGKSYSADIASQTTAATQIKIPNSETGSGKPPVVKAGDVLVKLTTTKALTGQITVTGAELVVVQENGTFAPAPSNTTLAALNIDVANVGNIDFGAHTATLKITHAATGATYKNVSDGDLIGGSLNSSSDASFTVNSKVYTVKGTNAANDFTVWGNGKVRQGTFTVKDVAIADEIAGTTVAYDEGTSTTKNGVTVTVTYTPATYDGDGKVLTKEVLGTVTSVSDLEAGEKATITDANGTAVYTTNGTTVTKTLTATDGVEEKWTQNIASTADIYVTGYAPAAGTFAWADGGYGYYAVNTAATPVATVNATVLTAAPTDGTTTPNYYVRAVVGGSKENGYTVKSVKLLANAKLTDVASDEALGKAALEALKGKVFKIAAPTDGDFTLASDAIGLPTGVERTFTINVDGAVAGKSYIGLGATDTVTTTTNLEPDETLKVGATADKAVTWSAAKSTAATINGDGTAYSGTFNLNSTYASLSAKNAAATGTTVKTTVVTAENGATAARVTFAAGAVSAIDYLADGESVKVVETDANGRIKTTTYTADSNGDHTYQITKVETADGVETKSICAKTDAVSDVTKLNYASATASITSNFDWTAAKGAGYFLVTPTKDANGAITGFGDVTVEKQSTPVTVSEGHYCLKVALGADGEVTGVTMHLIGSDGKPGADLLTTTMTGTITMTAPATAMAFNKSASTLNKATIAISGAAKSSIIQGLAAKDTLTTAVLSEGEAVGVNSAATNYTAGGSTTMKFVFNNSNNPVVSSGVLKFAANGNFIAAGDDDSAGTTGTDGTDGDNIAVTVTAGNGTPVVTVANGKITNITGLGTTGSVGAVVTGGVSLTYGPKNAGGQDTLTISGTTTGKTIKTIPLAANTLVSYTQSGAKTFTTAQAGVVTFVDEAGTMTLQSGVLKFTGTGASSEIALTGSSTKQTTDDVALQFTGTTSTTGVTVTVADGNVTSVVGLVKGDKLRLGTVTYEAISDTQITKTDSASTAGAAVANITKGADIMKANFVGGGTSVVDETTGEYLAGQLNWSDVSGRASGYFKISSNKTTVLEQDSKREVKPPTTNTDTYLVASVAPSDTVISTDYSAANVLTFSAITVDSTGKTASKELATLTNDTTINITASKTKAMVYEKDGAFKLAVKDLAANSVLTNLVAGDKATTTTLEIGNTVSVDGNVYVAGARNVLTIVGEAGTAALLTGTIRLTPGTAAILTGASERDDAGSATNDIGVIATIDTNVIVKATNGVVTSITGLDTKGATVEIRKYTTADHSKYTAAIYTVLDDACKMIEMKTGTEAGWTANTELYKQLSKAGAELDSATAYKDATKTGYKALASVTVDDFNFASTKQVVSYIEMDALTAGTTKTIAKTGAAGSDLLPTTTKTLKYDTYYLKVTGSKADAKGVTTITAVDLMLTDANAKPAAVKTTETTQYNGVLAIDGTTGTGTYAKVKYALPTGTKRAGAWTLDAKNVALGSTFTNLGEADKVDTQDGTWDFTNDGTSFVIYTNGVKGTNTQTVTYKGNAKNVKATVTGDALASVKGMSAGSLTVVSNADNAGVVTTVYEWKKVSGSTVLQKTVTGADGAIKVDTGTLAEGNDDILAATWTENKATSVTSDFDWTLDKSTTGYYKATTNTTFRGTKTIIKNTDASTYIAVTLNGSNEKDGEIASVAAMVFDTENGGMKAAADGTFTGKLTITAPTKSALKFDRANVDASIAESAQIVVSGALAGSEINGLAAHGSYKLGDSVTTAALKAAVKKNGVETSPAETVTVNNAKYKAGANGKLTFTAQPVGEGSNLADQLTLTGGAVLLAGDGTGTLGVDNVYVGNAQVTAANGSSIVVTATRTTAAGVTSYDISDIGENESFTVTSPVGGTAVTYTKSGTTLFCKYATDAGEFTKVYAINAATKISSTILDKAVTDAARVPTWKSLNATFTADENDFLTSKYGVVNVKLADFDKRIKADKATAGTYRYVIDTYISNTTAESKTKALAGTVVAAQDQNWQTLIGTANVGTMWYDASAATTGNKVGQTIAVSKDWNVTGSDGADIITGASANSVVNKVQNVTTINGGAGNDTITGGGATENFVVGNGNDVLKSYATGKDRIETAAALAGFQVDLAGTAFDSNGRTKLTGVLLYDAKDESGATANSVLLAGMGNGKAVEVSTDAGVTYAKYYFGDGTKARGAASFNFEEGAIYYANEKLTNTLKVATDKTKATKTTLGETVTVDLSNGDLYHNIAAIDAAASGNRVDMTALNTEGTTTTLKGGTYQSTLRGGAGSDSMVGGSGADMFWFESLAGNDTITSYTSKTDAIYLKSDELTIVQNETANSQVTIAAAADNKSVTLTNGENKVSIMGAPSATKAIRFSTDGTQANTLSYYVGTAKSNAANNFAASTATDMVLGTDTVLGANGTTTLTAYNYKSYYVGSALTAKDTLKLSVVDAKNKATVANGAFSLQSDNLASIDTLDASGLKAGSSIALIGAATGDCTLKGSTSNLTNEKFIVASTGTTVVQNLTKGRTIDDVIELSAGIKFADTGTNTKYGGVNGVMFKLSNEGQLFVSGAKVDQLTTVTAGTSTTVKRK